MISHAHRCILVHIQKTGGNSVRSVLGMERDDEHKHRLAVELRAIHGEPLWSDYFKFAFVRNPWDRLVSWWAMIDHRRRTGDAMNGFQRFIGERASSFEEFLTRCDAEYEDHDGRKWIFRNQIDYVADASGALLVDFVGRFERLAEDFAVIANRLGVPRTLPHENRSPRGEYARYYTPALADLVAERYARDLEAFGYRFER